MPTLLARCLLVDAFVMLTAVRVLAILGASNTNMDEMIWPAEWYRKPREV